MTVLAHLQDTLCTSQSQNRRSPAGETCKKATLLSRPTEKMFMSVSEITIDDNDASG